MKFWVTNWSGDRTTVWTPSLIMTSHQLMRNQRKISSKCLGLYLREIQGDLFSSQKLFFYTWVQQWECFQECFFYLLRSNLCQVTLKKPHSHSCVSWLLWSMSGSSQSIFIKVIFCKDFDTSLKKTVGERYWLKF